MTNKSLKDQTKKKKIRCFICKEDITKETKVVSYHNYPEHIWSNLQKNWKKNFFDLCNGVMCSVCAKKDLEIAFKKTQVSAIKEEVTQQLIKDIKSKNKFLVKFNLIKFPLPIFKLDTKKND